WCDRGGAMFLELLTVLALSATPASASQRAPGALSAASNDTQGGGFVQVNNRRTERPRWHRGVCVGATGLTTQQAQFLVDRISQRAQEVGLTPGRPGCDANVVVVFTADPHGVASQITRS